MKEQPNRRPLISAGFLLGIGMGGFVDGILFHQIFQVHNMLSARYPVRDVDVQTLAVNLEINMFWDGLFHAFTWAITLFGIVMLWRAVGRENVPLSSTTFAGSLALGWGMFNLVEGVINHHILHTHHVLETENHLLWDLIFLASGAVLMLIGGIMIWAARHDRVARP